VTVLYQATGGRDGSSRRIEVGDRATRPARKARRSAARLHVHASRRTRRSRFAPSRPRASPRRTPCRLATRPAGRSTDARTCGPSSTRGRRQQRLRPQPKAKRGATNPLLERRLSGSVSGRAVVVPVCGRSSDGGVPPVSAKLWSLVTCRSWRRCGRSPRVASNLRPRCASLGSRSPSGVRASGRGAVQRSFGLTTWFRLKKQLVFQPQSEAGRESRDVRVMHAQIETPAFAGVSLAGHKPDSSSEGSLPRQIWLKACGL